MIRRRLPAGVFFTRKQERLNMAGVRCGDVTVVRNAAHHRTCWVQCDFGHEALKDSATLRRSLKTGESVRCAECRRLAVEAKRQQSASGDVRA